MFEIEALHHLCPSLPSAIAGGFSGLLLFLVSGFWAAKLHRNGWRVGDTRKIFHFSIFTGAAVVRWQVDPASVLVFGTVVACGVLHAVWQGNRSALFRALARPDDAPHQRLHVVAPLLSTAVGGVLAQWIAGPLAVVAFLVTGWGDAVGEPIGIRWGRHRYRVPTWGVPNAERSWEGSAAVLVASSLAAAFGLVICGYSGMNVAVYAVVLGISATVIEAISPHGFDNLTLLVAVASLSRLGTAWSDFTIH